jgi:hypothetical protein
MNMDPEIKAKWIEALRSGKYKQARMALRRDDRFCCLGVLCDVAGATWEPFAGEPCATFPGIETRCAEVLSDEAQNMLGLPFERHEQLWHMNDDEGRSFDEIADYIEANL